MDDSVSKGENNDTERVRGKADSRVENAQVVDCLTTDDTSPSANVQDGVQNALGNQHDTSSNLVTNESEVIVSGIQAVGLTPPTDQDNGNLSEDEVVDDERKDAEAENVKQTEALSNKPDIEIEAPSNDATDTATTLKEKEEIKGLDEGVADIPFADDGVLEDKPQMGGPPDVIPVEKSNSSSSGTVSSEAGVGSLALPMPGTSTSSEVTQSSSSTSVSTESGGSKRRDDSPQSIYHVKWIMFKEKKVPLITQNENGPCPLLAIINYLLLKEKIKLPTTMEIITADQLMEYLGNCVFDQVPKNVSEDAQLNIEQNVNDAMSMFHKLQTGLDVNVKFTGVADFEYTSECIVFDILGIPMYHGWLVDPQSPEVEAAVGHSSYNQLVEKIITQKSSEKEELVTEALIAEQFLMRTASQLTYHGLCELCISVKEEELAVLFRNNHFSTIYKHKNELFLLVTDQGFLNESNVVWETLSNVEGDGNFVDAEFRTYRKPEASTHTIPSPPVPAGSDQQVDQDYLVALSLQQEQQNHQDQAIALEENPEQAVPQSPHQVQSDLELALQLQEEENRQATRAQAQAQQQQANQQRMSQIHQEETERQQRQQQEGRRKSGDCSIL